MLGFRVQLNPLRSSRCPGMTTENGYSFGTMLGAEIISRWSGRSRLTSVR
jgi:hypothetical protein